MVLHQSHTEPVGTSYLSIDKHHLESAERNLHLVVCESEVLVERHLDSVCV